MPISKDLLLDISMVITGGALGSMFRFLLSKITQHVHVTSSPFPYPTFVVNIIGCFLIGYLIMRIPAHGDGNLYRLFFITGFLGSFTTFSAFSLETLNLIHTGHMRTAIMNIAVSTLGGIGAVIAGMAAFGFLKK